MDPSESVRRTRRRRGFTLVELLVVIGIITLLIGILFPALRGARRNAKITSCRALLGALEAGIASFKADSTFGGSLPPSRPDSLRDPSSAGQRTVSNPHEDATGTRSLVDTLYESGTDARRGLSGASLLLWALVGADLQGTPGFEDLDGDGTWYDDQWRGQTDNVEAAHGAYGQHEVSGRPLEARAPLYMDLRKGLTAPPVEPDNPENNTYSVPAAKNDTHKIIGTPIFLDAWKQPVLYYKANRTDRQMVNRDSTYRDADDYGVYDPFDNNFWTGLKDTFGPITPTLPTEAIDMGDWFQRDGSPPYIHPLSQVGDDPNLPGASAPSTFEAFIRDRQLSARTWPVNSDSYIIIMAGPDHIYGTEDDVTNFQR